MDLVRSFGPPIGESKLCKAPVIREPFVAVLPKNHPMAVNKILSAKDFRQDPFIIVPHDLAPGMYRQILGICSDAGFHPSIYQEVGQMDIILNFVAAELGIALLPRSIMLFHHEGVVYRPLDSVSILAEVDVIWKDHSHSPILVNYLDITMRIAKNFL